MDKTIFATGALLALLGVAAGAFGAHALSARLSASDLAIYETAARYQMYHAFGLMVIGLAFARWPQATSLIWSFRLMLIGTLIFCTTLYAIALGAPRWLGAITPIGGVCMIAGWGIAAFAAWRA